MPSELDQALASAFAGLSAPGGLLETGMVRDERFGIELPVLLRAPPTLPAYFAQFCAQHGDAEFLVDGDVRLSFAETYAAARVAAGGLVAGHGVAPGEFVGIAARNSANWIVAYMAVLMAGGCATLLNGWWHGAELNEAIGLGPCRLVIADEERAGRIEGQGHLEGQGHAARLLKIRHDCPPAEGLAPLTERGGGADTPLPEVRGEDLATMLFTSGSTGRAKGALSDHRAVVQAAMNYVAQTMTVLGVMLARGTPPRSRPAALVNVPLFHVTGEVPVLLQSFFLGRKIVLMPKWDALAAMRLIEREKVTYFVGVPSMSYDLATHPERERFDLSSCITFAAGGAPRPPEHVRQIRDALPHGFPILGYGLTETNAVGCGNYNENYLAKPGSTGRPSPPLVDLAILDERGVPLPQGRIGEIGIRSVCNIREYWRNEQATKDSFTGDGYVLSGDLGYLDEDGYLFIVDRKKDVILRGGENISSIEVEEALFAHPDVVEAAVVGIPDAHYGEVPVAAYVAREGSQLMADDLRSFVAGRIASFKVPVRIWRFDAPLPRLGTEKIDKRSLREQLTERAKRESG